MSFSTKPSRFIKSISSRYLRISGNNCFSHLYNVLPNDYQFSDKILDIYSKEEMVRQWLLKELQIKYHYPLALLAVEYRINIMSRIGFVDICIQVHRDGEFVPYIFCEVKAPGSGTAEGLNQLKSYMSSNKLCQYGLVTDGASMVIIDVNFKPIADIPAFKQIMLPSTMEKYNYLSFDNKQRSTLVRDCNLASEVIIETAAGSELQSGYKLKRVPTYEGIAAGQPIFMQGKSEAEFYLPADWLRGRENCYLLRVKGDSMIDAGIDDQDHVLIQEQSTAQSRDIVAVAIEDEATLKRYVPMGDTVLLLPENPDYEPIHLSDNEARIVGVAIGVLKKA